MIEPSSLVLAPLLSSLLGLAAIALARPRLAQAAVGVAGLLNVVSAALLLAAVLEAGPLTVSFGGWLVAEPVTSPHGRDPATSFAAIGPLLRADALAAALAAAIAFVLALTALRPLPPASAGDRALGSGRPRAVGVSCSLVALGAQTACLAADLATQLVALEVAGLGAALLAAERDPERGAWRILGPSLILGAVAALALVVLHALGGTTRLDALPLALGALPPQTRDVGQVAILVLVATHLARGAALPAGAWLMRAIGGGGRAGADGLGPVVAVVAVAGLAAFARLHLAVTDGLEAAVASGCAPCEDLRLEHLDAVIGPLGAAASLLAALGALTARSLPSLAGWLLLGAQGLTLSALASASPAVAGLQLLQTLLAGSALLAVAESRRKPPTAAVRITFTLATAALLGLPPFASFAARIATWRAGVDGLPLLLLGLAALVVASLAVIRSASRHLWQDTNTEQGHGGHEFHSDATMVWLSDVIFAIAPLIPALGAPVLLAVSGATV